MGDFDAAHLLVEDDGMRWKWIWVGRQPVETFMYRISAWRGRSLVGVDPCQERNEDSWLESIRMGRYKVEPFMQLTCWRRGSEWGEGETLM